MRRALLTALAVLFVAAPAAEAAEVSGRLVFCTGDDICRYFPEPRLEVAFVAAPGEANELRLTSHPDGVRVVDAGAAITTGTYCTPVSPNEAVCGPPAPSGLLATAFTGDAADSAVADTGSVLLGRGRDHGVAEGASIDGGRGADRLISAGGGSLLTGAAGRDHLSGTNGEEVLTGGSGKDLLVARGGADTVEGGKGADLVAGGAGRDDIHAGSGDDLIHATDPARDTVRCGRGDDRALVSARDRVFGCERVSRRVDE
jgi:Ca2+-binding RTX toxin-like protein